MTTKYILSFSTYALIPHKKGHRLCTKVIDKRGTVILQRKPMYFVQSSCRALGTRYEAARAIAKAFFVNQHKVPIAIAQDFGVPCIFFPIFSPSSDQNYWLALHAIVHIEPHPDGCIITLKNEEQLVIPLRHTAFAKQYANATLLYKFYKTRRQEIILDAPF